MRTSSLGRTGGILALVTVAALALTGCVDVTYNVSVNPDSTVSGSLVLEVNKQAAKVLGISSAADLDSKIKSGELSSQTEAEVVSNCAATETDDSLALNCAFSNLEVSDISKDWSLTTEGDSATLHLVSNASAGMTSLPTDMGLGTATVNITFPGAITAVTGEHASQTGTSTVVVSSDISEPIDVTVTGVVATGASIMWLIYLGLGLLAVIVVAALVLVLRRGSAGAATSAANEDAAALEAGAAPAIEAAAPAVEAAPAMPELQAGDAPDASGSGDGDTPSTPQA